MEGLEPGAASPSVSCGEHSHFWSGWNTGVLQKYCANQRPSGNTGIPSKAELHPQAAPPHAAILHSGNHRYPAVFLETLSVYAFNSLPISEEHYTLQPPASNNNYDKFTCPKWERSREISIKHCMWSLVWEVIFNSWDTEKLMTLFRHYSNKLIKNHLFFQLVLMYYAN